MGINDPSYKALVAALRGEFGPGACSVTPSWSKEHVAFKCTCWRTGCQFCDGGLFACSVCHSFEGATTTHCPGVDMYAEYGERVYRGEIDFRDGEWREGECSKSSPAFRRVR